jgi:predicted nuclease of predicted toxin-antitoxin system
MYYKRKLECLLYIGMKIRIIRIILKNIGNNEVKPIIRENLLSLLEKRIRWKNRLNMIEKFYSMDL